MASTARLSAPALAPHPNVQRDVQRDAQRDVPTNAQPVKFDAEFIERRLHQHNQWREFAERVYAARIIREVLHGVFDEAIQ